MKTPISVLIPVRNEIRNLQRCMKALDDWADEVVVVDSHSTDGSAEWAVAHGAQVVQFDYRGGWPKKRQWALDTYPFRNEWILLLDADEILLGGINQEITDTMGRATEAGFWLRFEIVFLGRQLPSRQQFSVETLPLPAGPWWV